MTDGRSGEVLREQDADGKRDLWRLFLSFITKIEVSERYSAFGMHEEREREREISSSCKRYAVLLGISPLIQPKTDPSKLLA